LILTALGVDVKIIMLCERSQHPPPNTHTVSPPDTRTVHTVRFQLARILENANQSVLMEKSCVALSWLLSAQDQESDSLGPLTLRLNVLVFKTGG
jgi:hypothetical protein